ncbi:MAG: hypothetical protein ABFC56_10950 [Clostridiaceae bacterium]
MVKELLRKSVTDVCTKVWPLAQDPTHQFYPLFESEEDVRDTLSWTMEDDDARAYGYWRERALEGVCCLFIENQQHYVLIIALYAWGNFRAAVNAFMRKIEEEFAGYTIECAIAGEHTRFAAKLIRSGFALQDDRFNMRRVLPAQIAQESLPDLELRLLEREVFKEYAPLHGEWFHDSITSAEDLEYCPENRLIVTARREGRIIGAVFVQSFAHVGQICGLHAEDGLIARALLIEAMQKSAMRLDVIEALEWMIQRNDPSLAVLYDLGFEQAAHYTFYHRDVSE